MNRTPEIKQGDIFKDRAGLGVKVERIDPNHRIRFSVVENQSTAAGPGEMSYESFVSRFCPSDQEFKPSFDAQESGVIGFPVASNPSLPTPLRSR